MSDNPSVRFDRFGVPYVEYEDLVQQPRVQDQLRAARKLIDRIKTESPRREGAPQRNGTD